MNAARPDMVGATRVCPHCKATVLASSAICPGCHHHLRFNAADSKPGAAGYPALNFEGTFRHPVNAEACEYSIVLAVTNDRGEKLTRQVISVGALQPTEARSISLSVELTAARTPAPRK
jgi:hypothetical protein